VYTFEKGQVDIAKNDSPPTTTIGQNMWSGKHQKPPKMDNSATTRC
jgi:hypothetical protein